MNWQAKSPVKLTSLAMLLSLFFFSCQESLEISEVPIPKNNDTELKVIDIPIDITHAFFDQELRSSNNSSLDQQKVYFGFNSNPEIGEVTAEAYLGMELDGSISRNTIGQGSTFLDAYLTLNYTDFYGVGFNSGQEVIVRPLTEIITLESDTAYYSIYDSAQTSNELISVGKTTAIDLENLNSDTFSDTIPLDPNFAEDLFNVVRNSAVSEQELIEYFSGVAINNTGRNNILQAINLNNDSFLEIRYRIAGTNDTSSFKFYTTNSSFTGIDFKPSDEFPSDFSGNKSFNLQSDNKAFFNSMLGLYPRININKFFDFADTISYILDGEEVDYMIVDKAELMIRNSNLENQFTETISLKVPETVYPYYIKNNSILNKGEIFWGIQNNFNSGGFISDQSEAGNIASSNFNPSTNKIAVNVTMFIQELYENPDFWDFDREIILSGQRINSNSRAFDYVPKFYLDEFTQFAVDKSDIKLRVYYTTFKN